MIAETIPGLRSLSPDQKILLAAELWSEAVGTAPDPDPELVKALRERLDFHNDHPEDASKWDAVRARITARNRKNA